MDANSNIGDVGVQSGSSEAGARSGSVTTEAQARKAGFTREVIAASLGQDLNVLIKPGTDLDAEFEAFDLDVLEMIKVRGWLGVFDDV
jgi:hypothetical protein